MKLIAFGAGTRIGVIDDVVIVDPEDRLAEVNDALTRTFDVTVPGGDDGTIAEEIVTLAPGDPGHAEAALRSLPWVEFVDDLDATLPDEG